MKYSIFAMACTFGLAAPTAFADDVLTVNNGIVRAFLCVGDACTNPESYVTSLDTLRLKSANMSIHFDDTSMVSGFPSNDWRIVANDNFSGGQSYLAITDVTGLRTPFKILAGARENALFIAQNGNMGLGTSLPAQRIHVQSTDTPAIRFQQSGGSFPPYAWDFRGNESGFFFSDVTGGQTIPFLVRPGAASFSLLVNNNGDLGVGAPSPEGKLHTRGDGTQLIYFQSADNGAVQVRFRTDSQNRRFLAVNNANEVKSQIVFGDNQIQFLGETVAQEWLRISSAGIVSSGPTCNPNPCDRTFDPEYFEVPSIEERAAYMWENMHLPAVGPTEPGKPFNLTEKTAGMLHELEIAHIYIAQQAEENTAQSLLIAQQAQVIAELSARVDALEAR